MNTVAHRRIVGAIATIVLDRRLTVCNNGLDQIILPSALFFCHRWRLDNLVLWDIFALLSIKNLIEFDNRTNILLLVFELFLFAYTFERFCLERLFCLFVVPRPEKNLTRFFTVSDVSSKFFYLIERQPARITIAFHRRDNVKIKSI